MAQKRFFRLREILNQEDREMIQVADEMIGLALAIEKRELAYQTNGPAEKNYREFLDDLWGRWVDSHAFGGLSKHEWVLIASIMEDNQSVLFDLFNQERVEFQIDRPLDLGDLRAYSTVIRAINNLE